MKRIPSAFLALAVTGTLVFVFTSWKHGVTPVHAQGGCDVTTLNGPYPFKDTGFVAPGHSVTGAENAPVAAVGVEGFDGAGGLSANYTLVTNGKVFTESGTGTYTLNLDCTGSESFTTGDAAGLTFNIVVIGGGAEIFGIHTSSGITGAFDAKKK